MDLLQGYSSSSDSEVDLGSAADTEDINLPPVPEAITDRYSIAPNILKFTEDIESMRFVSPFKIKDFQANKGKWSSFLFIEYKPSLTERDKLLQNITKFNRMNQTRNPELQEFEPLHISPLGVAAPLHISLSRNILFEDINEREHFYNLLSQKLAPMPQFLVQFEDKVNIVTAKEKSRLYLTLDVAKPVKTQYIVPIMTAIEKSLVDSGIKDAKSFLLDPKYAHMSIADIKFAQGPTVDEYQPQDATNIRDTPCVYENTPVFLASGIKYNRNRQVLTIPLQK